MSRRSPYALAACLALLVVPLIVVPAAAAPSAAAFEHARILEYWTPARMAAAKPLDIAPVGAGLVPTAKGGKPGPPGGGGGGSGGTGNVTGASWTNGGAVVKQTGKVWFHMGNGDYICSGSVITDSRGSYSTVLTAGHCAYDNGTGKFVTNWMFIPSFDTNPTYTCANTTFGCWSATALVIHAGFANATSFNTAAITHDWAFAVVGGGGKSGTAQLDTTVGGSYGITLNASPSRLEAFGYPAGAPYNGSDLTWCAGPTATNVSTSDGSTWGMSCNMTGGSSGGPWFDSTFVEPGETGTVGSGGSVGSLNSYKYSNDSSHMYGPIFNSNTQDTLGLAQSTTLGNQVAP